MVARGILYVSLSAGNTGDGELWAYDGSSSVRRVRGGFGSGPWKLAAYGDRVVFAAGLPGEEDEPWISDGTFRGTYRLADAWPGITGSRPEAFSNVGGRLFFVAGNETGYEPWISDGTPSGTHQLADVFAADPAGFTTPQTVSLGDRVVFRHSDLENSTLWTNDGTPSGTEILLEWSSIRSHVAHGGRLYLIGAPEDEPLGLYVTNVPSSGAELLAAVDAVRPTVALGSLWFSTGSTGQQLWVTSGTAAGTRQVIDVDPDYSSWCLPPCLPPPDYPREMTGSGGSLFFVAREQGTSPQLWVTDGLAAGTAPLGAFPDSFEGPEKLTAHGGGVLFTVADPSIGTELWWSDGTPEGTAPVADLLPGPVSSSPRELTRIGSATLFVTRGPDGGSRLWRADGAPPVVSEVSDLVLGGLPSQVGSLTGDGSRVFLSLYHSGLGQELWATDGTAEGTELVTDLRPGRAGSYPNAIAFAGGRLFFAADDGVTGLELWSTDGTAAGTEQVQDLSPGPTASSPDAAALAGDRLIFFADDGVRGFEPWVLDLAAPVAKPSHRIDRSPPR